MPVISARTNMNDYSGEIEILRNSHFAKKRKYLVHQAHKTIYGSFNLVSLCCRFQRILTWANSQSLYFIVPSGRP